jgi:hypothetical protein
VRAGSVGEGGADHAQVVVLDGIEHTQTGVGAVARHQHHFHARMGGAIRIQGQQLVHQIKRNAGLQQFIFMQALIRFEDFQTLLLEHAVACIQIKQCPRRDRHHEWLLAVVVVQRNCSCRMRSSSE